MGAMRALLIAALVTASWACGDDGDHDHTEADLLGIGAQCGSDEDCDEEHQVCLMQFKGGYCGMTGCTTDEDCPEASACVAHNGANYCFRTCRDKAECNVNRDPEHESNCSSNVTWVDEGGPKACVPPSS